MKPDTQRKLSNSILAHNLVAILQSFTRARSGLGPIDTFIDKTIAAVLAVEVPTNTDALKQQYRKNLVKYMSRAVKTSTVEFIVNYYMHPTKMYLRQARELDTHRAITGAAAVGNLTAIKYFLDTRLSTA